MVIPQQYQSAVIAALKLQKATMEQVLNMDEYQLLETWSKLEEFQFVQDLMKSKSTKDLMEDIQIKSLVSSHLESIKKDHGDTVELLQLLESPPHTDISTSGSKSDS